MRMNLGETEIRILGSLMEKELATPENYPLTLNALQSACNQKSNRNPVLNLTEGELEAGLRSLGGRGLARLTTTGGRVAKYCHSVTAMLGLSDRARAVLAELMLRGPQTAAELRGRAGRMVDLADPGEVEAVLQELQRLAPPLVALLPRQAGRKEQRYAQLLAGPPELPEEPEFAAEREPTAERRRAPEASGLVRLEAEVGVLRGEVGELRREVEELISLFS